VPRLSSALIVARELCGLSRAKFRPLCFRDKSQRFRKLTAISFETLSRGSEEERGEERYAFRHVEIAKARKSRSLIIRSRRWEHFRRLASRIEISRDICRNNTTVASLSPSQPPTCGRITQRDFPSGVPSSAAVSGHAYTLVRAVTHLYAPDAPCSTRVILARI